MTLQELVTHFKVSRRLNDSSYQCECPVHRDNKASLTISEKKGKLLLHCHAGCDTKDILEEIGLSFSDIGEYKEPKWKESLEFWRNKPIEAVYDYYSESSKYLYSKVRFEGKEIVYAVINKKQDTVKYGRGTTQTTLYNLPALLKAVKEGYPVYIVEGEKDVETLKKLGYTATTAGGVQDWKKEYSIYFTGAKVTILPDNDPPGLELKDQILRDLKHYAHSIRWAITSEAEKGDVTDYLEQHTKEELKELLANSENIGAPWIYIDGSGDKAKAKINADILADSISRGISYLIVRRPEEDKDDFFFYENGVYNKCNRNKVKSVIRRYIPVGMASDNMINNVYNLMLCKESNIITFRDLDTNEWYINLKNGLYNLKTRSLEPHTPKLYSTLQLNCEYHPEDNNRPVFERYMNDLCSDGDENVDEEKKAIIQEYMGLILSNVNVYRIKMALVLWSILGNSGKTQILNLVGKIIGEDRIANIPIQHMNESSKFALGSIMGKRIISIGDQTGSEIKDSSVFKQVTGGDPVKVEPKNKQPYYYIFPGGIVVACNNLPTFQDDKGGHMFERLCIVPCINTIPQERRDGELLDKMLLERNAVFNWFLEGLHRLIDNNFKISKSKACDEAMNEYREKMDTVYRYLSENYIITGNKSDMISKPDFDSAYIAWCDINEFNHVNKQNIKDRMEANGCPNGQGRINGKAGVMVYRNLKQKNNGFQNVTEEEYRQHNFPF
uniref:DsDNA helicase n=1 Tax=Myoviridae sp. ct2cn10 TaxID=2825022 RepID=A0A8S5PA37_9CAUD|nr:phage/plasmid primase, P4 family [uncultured Lachnoclostridium sp.]DAE03934.1 MAG TPA: dsDNA helicase [Myoviridae sp. ct2cn10]